MRKTQPDEKNLARLQPSRLISGREGAGKSDRQIDQEPLETPMYDPPERIEHLFVGLHVADHLDVSTYSASP